MSEIREREIIVTSERLKTFLNKIVTTHLDSKKPKMKSEETELRIIKIILSRNYLQFFKRSSK
ncbi:hypothetical protein MAQA_14834 [Listeria aquatica FSL S10-1188]|uniref:Uncharacterized protein n=1 Tax=Listeria aquatica FSL S10-1188 TaxID=1265818 RepID=W7B2F3_9LIST|nr:hypothetical protein MAQA_14834 [Listeria aquatica FSL S10-1188]